MINDYPISLLKRTSLFAITALLLGAPTARADAVTEWNVRAGEFITASGLITQPASRVMAIAKKQAGFAAELLLWCRRGGADVTIPEFCADHSCALEAAGRWQQAAEAWRGSGCPFETARALADGDENAQREALAIFESLGARPMVERVRLRLRDAGVRGVPRGPRSSTRQLAAGLTSKEFAVLLLLAAGLRNKEITERLSQSARTIDHHMESIFAKLAVTTRAEAVSAAYRLGIVAADPHPSSA